MLALRLSGLVPYQGRNRPSASNRPPSTARNSPRPRRPRFMHRRAYNVPASERARTPSDEGPSPGIGHSTGGTVTNSALVVGEDGRARCYWAGSAPEYIAYHDDEWGRPVRTDQGLYERMTLEAFQSGLAWITILRKRENFRAAFAGFEIEAVAAF